MIYAYASLPHYADHLQAIVAGLPPGLRGGLYAAQDGKPWGPALPPDIERERGAWMLVAGLADAQRFGRSKRLIYLEHGSGQTYVDIPTNGSYSGGDHSGIDVRLYLCPSQTVADRWTPVPAAVVGCPKLDRWHRRVRVPGPPTVAFSWHWPCELVPETVPAFHHYERVLPDIFARLDALGVTVLGHAHPRYIGRISRFYQEQGVPWTADLNDVFRQADVLVADNTSALYEACAIGMSTVVLNAPWYRRDVEHGLRFWSAVPGPQVDDPADLLVAIETALLYPEATAPIRRRGALAAYDHLDGRSADRAVLAIVRTVEGTEMSFGKYGETLAVVNTSEVATPKDQLRARMQQLGAGDDVIQAVMEFYDRPAGPDELTGRQLLALNDDELRAQIVAVEVEWGMMQPAPSRVEAQQSAVETLPDVDQAVWNECWNVIHQAIPKITSWVGTDPHRALIAARVEVEDAAANDREPRKSLLKILTLVHGQDALP